MGWDWSREGLLWDGAGTWVPQRFSELGLGLLGTTAPKSSEMRTGTSLDDGEEYAVVTMVFRRVRRQDGGELLSERVLEELIFKN